MAVTPRLGTTDVGSSLYLLAGAPDNHQSPSCSDKDMIPHGWEPMNTAHKVVCWKCNQAKGSTTGAAVLGENFTPV